VFFEFLSQFSTLIKVVVVVVVVVVEEELLFIIFLPSSMKARRTRRLFVTKKTVTIATIGITTLIAIMLLVLRLLLLAPLLGFVEGDAADCPETRYIADECRDGTKSEPPALSFSKTGGENNGSPRVR
jgi:hypothetical protein